LTECACLCKKTPPPQDNQNQEITAKLGNDQPNEPKKDNEEKKELEEKKENGMKQSEEKKDDIAQISNVESKLEVENKKSPDSPEKHSKYPHIIVNLSEDSNKDSDNINIKTAIINVGGLIFNFLGLKNCYRRYFEDFRNHFSFCLNIRFP